MFLQTAINKRVKQKNVTVKVSPFTKGEELCNRTACQTNKGVSFYNKTMDAWYCVKCARLINDANRDNPLCRFDEDRNYYEKNIKHQNNMTWKEYKTGKEIFIF